jgi:hypothetical protein
LLPGLWYYDEGLRDSDDYREYIESLRSKKEQQSAGVSQQPTIYGIAVEQPSRYGVGAAY